MEKCNKRIITLLAVIVAGILLSIPVGFMMQKESFASTAKSVAAVNNITGNDYIFVVLEDEAVPLAAAPISKGFNPTAVFAVVATLFAVSFMSYSYWYIMTRCSIKSYSYAVTNNELSRIIPSKAFLHPLQLSNAEREILFRAATK